MSGILEQKLLMVRFGGGGGGMTSLGHEGTFCSDGHYLYREGRRQIHRYIRDQNSSNHMLKMCAFYFM